MPTCSWQIQMVKLYPEVLKLRALVKSLKDWLVITWSADPECICRLIYGWTKQDHITPLLRDKLHWLRFWQRIAYKLCLAAYKAMRERYIRELIIPASRTAARARLRSARTDSHLGLPASAPQLRRARIFLCGSMYNINPLIYIIIYMHRNWHKLNFIIISHI